MYDLLIRNGRVVDGTGAPAYPADVAVAGQEIVAIGKLEGEAAQTIDARGLVVCPGFVDLHTHSDLSFLLDPTAQSKVRQGVTLELTGNCGFSFAAPIYGQAVRMLEDRVAAYGVPFEPAWRDFAGYLDALAQKGSTLNLAAQVGHGTVRACVLGYDARAPSGEELERMQALVAEALDAGALGFSTGLFYAPGNYARLEEVIALAQVAADRGKLYSSHIRDEGDDSVGLFVALNEAIEVGRRTGVRVEVSHVKCASPSTWGRAADVLELLERARHEGINVCGDQYPYEAGSTLLTGALFPRWALEGGRQATLARLQDAAQRGRVRAGIEDTFRRRDASRILIATYAPQREYEGHTLEEVARDLECAPAEAALRLYERSDAMVIMFHLQEPDMDVIARAPFIAVGSDGSSLNTTGPLSVGKPHPRSYGTNPRFLARFVREKRLVGLEEAVRKMTLLPATHLGLTRRGRLAPGMYADIVVFDPETVADTATFTDPHRFPVGVPHVVVNGTPVIRDGEVTGATPGRVVRGFGE